MTELLTFLLTDIESSTALWELYPDAMSTALADHERIIADAVAKHGGKLVRGRGEGDSTFAVFRSPADAVAASAVLARALALAPWSAEAPLRVRVAVYTGEAEGRGGDFFGTTVNRAARMRSLAFGGQVLLGEATAAAVAANLPPQTALVDLGPRPLKDLSAPEHVYELRLEDAGVLPEPLSDADASNLLWAERTLWSGFVGRFEERRQLGEAWSSAVSGQRVLALVEGEPGIGKTALAAEVARAAVAGGGLVLYGRWDEDLLAPFQGFREALGAYAKACPRSILRADLRDHGDEIARLFPEVGDRIEADAVAGGLGAEAERLRLFSAVEEWLAAIAGRRPVVLVLDDLHWADRPSLLLLQHLVRASRPSSLLVVATFRGTDLDHNELGSLLSELKRDILARRLSLSGLAKADVAALLELVSGRDLGVHAGSLAEELHAETGGNPLFLREIVHHLGETDALEAASLRNVDLPDTVRDLVRWRMRLLPDAARDGLAAASVMGQEFDRGVLTTVTGMDEGLLSDALDDARRAGVVHEAGNLGDRYVFSHAIVRRTLLDDLSGARRALLHWRIGEALERRDPPASPAQLAHHFCAAVNHTRADKAIDYAHAAGDRAIAELAYEAAVQHYRRALEIQNIQRPQAAGLRCELLLALGDAHDKAGEYADRDERFLEAADHARRLERPDLFARAALGYGGVLPAAVDPNPQGHALLEEALQRLGDRASRERWLVLARLAHWLTFVAPRDRRKALADEAVEMARRLGDAADLATVLVHRCWALDGPDDLHDQLRDSDEILSLGERLEDRQIVLDGLRCRSDALFESGDIDALREAVDEMARLAGELKHPEYTRLSRSWDAVWAVIEGRFDDALAIADEVHELMRALGHPQTEVVYIALTYPIRWFRGELAEALPVYEALVEAEPWRQLWPAVVAWCAAESGMVDRAREGLDAMPPGSIAAIDKNYLWWPTIVGLTDAVSLLGDRDRAEVLYDLVLPYGDRLCPVGQASFLGVATYHLGALAATLGRWDAAAAHFESALERLERMKARPFLALTQQTYASMLVDRDQPGDHDRARGLQDAAQRTAAELGLRAVETRASVRPARG